MQQNIKATKYKITKRYIDKAKSMFLSNKINVHHKANKTNGPPKIKDFSQSDFNSWYLQKVNLSKFILSPFHLIKTTSMYKEKHLNFLKLKQNIKVMNFTYYSIVLNNNVLLNEHLIKLTKAYSEYQQIFHLNIRDLKLHQNDLIPQLIVKYQQVQNQENFTKIKTYLLVLLNRSLSLNVYKKTNINAQILEMTRPEIFSINSLLPFCEIYQINSYLTNLTAFQTTFFRKKKRKNLSSNIFSMSHDPDLVLQNKREQLKYLFNQFSENQQIEKNSRIKKTRTFFLNGNSFKLLICFEILETFLIIFSLKSLSLKNKNEKTKIKLKDHNLIQKIVLKNTFMSNYSYFLLKKVFNDYWFKIFSLFLVENFSFLSLKKFKNLNSSISILKSENTVNKFKNGSYFLFSKSKKLTYFSILFLFFKQITQNILFDISLTSNFKNVLFHQFYPEKSVLKFTSELSNFMSFQPANVIDLRIIDIHAEFPNYSNLLQKNDFNVCFNQLNSFTNYKLSSFYSIDKSQLEQNQIKKYSFANQKNLTFQVLKKFAHLELDYKQSFSQLGKKYHSFNFDLAIYEFLNYQIKSKHLFCLSEHIQDCEKNFYYFVSIFLSKVNFSYVLKGCGTMILKRKIPHNRSSKLQVNKVIWHCFLLLEKHLLSKIDQLKSPFYDFMNIFYQGVNFLKMKSQCIPFFNHFYFLTLFYQNKFIILSRTKNFSFITLTQKSEKLFKHICCSFYFFGCQFSFFSGQNGTKRKKFVLSKDPFQEKKQVFFLLDYLIYIFSLKSNKPFQNQVLFESLSKLQENKILRKSLETKKNYNLNNLNLDFVYFEKWRPFYFTTTISKTNVQEHLIQLQKIIQNSGNQTQQKLIQNLYRQIASWCYYYKFVTNQEFLNYCDFYLFKCLWKWACKRHSNKSKKWIKLKYFHRFQNRHWVFGTYNSRINSLFYLPSHYEMIFLKNE